MTAVVVITGAGAITPFGSHRDLGRRCGAGEPAARTGAVPVIPLAELPESVRARAARAERITQLAFAAAHPALAAAGLAVCDGPPRPRLGVVLGTAFGCFLTNVAYQRRVDEAGPAGASPRLFAATVSNAAAGELSIAYRLGGPAVTLSAGAASGLVALGHATDLLRTERADALLAGGVDAYGDALLAWMRGAGLATLPPTEAAACVVLETVASARARRARPVGTIEAHASGFDPPGPRHGAGLRGVVTTVLVEAGVTPSELARVVSGGEPEAPELSQALGDVVPAALTPKLELGETFAAAGPLGLLAALGMAPPGGPVLVLDRCASGHVAALVARRVEDG